jgi:hypothetical protein
LTGQRAFRYNRTENSFYFLEAAAMNTADLLRILLFATILVLAGLALVSLRRRQLDWQSAPAWVLLAICVPLVGPLLVIALRPGKPR